MVNALTIIVNLAYRWRNEPHDCTGNGRFTAAGFANDAECLATHYLQVYAINSVYVFLVTNELAAFKSQLVKKIA